VSDTCQNNFATWNPLLGPQTCALADGNLTVTSDGANNHKGTRSTFGVTSGKWYWEYRVGSVVSNSYVGVSHIMSANGLSGDDYMLHGTNSNNYAVPSGSFSVTNAAFTTGMIIGVAFDYDNGTMDVYKDGTIAVQFTGGSFRGLSYHAHISFNAAVSDGWEGNFGQNPTFSGVTTAGTYTDSNGKGLFKYQPPSGFLALCEDNLPTPTIKDPGEHFKTVLYIGDGSSRAVTGVGFQPDLVWLKQRNGTAYNALFDSVRGPGRQLHPNENLAEGSGTQLTGFDSDGFSLNSSSNTYNGNGSQYVAWCWKAGGAAVSNTDGTITSQVSANQTAGFSIVSYTGDGSDANRTVGHGLGKTPAFIIVKARDEASRHWLIWHNAYGNDEAMLFNTGTPAGSRFGPDAPTSNVFGVYGGQGNRGTTKFISYCWAEIEGFSKFGSYVGNLNADGPFVYCGFKPAWVMIKRTVSTGNWCIHDSSRGPVNVMNEQLQANLSNEESGIGGLIDFLSNGFKIRATSTDLNASGATYIFAAFAESPFTTANAK